MRKDRLMRKFCCIYAYQSAAISIVAMIGCIITAAVGLPCGGKFDYLGLIIGILALMVTFVVAWQIWQTIASRDEIKEARIVAEKAKEEVSGVETRLMKEINLAMATSYQQFAMIYRDKELKELGDKGFEKLNLFFSTCYSLKRIIHLSKAQEYKLCDDEIDWIRFLLIQQESNYQYHKTIQTLLGQIEHTDEISKFSELRDCLTEMFPVSEEDIRRHHETVEALRRWKEDQSKNES